MSSLTPITYQIRPATNEDVAAVKDVFFLTLEEFGLPASRETTGTDLNDLETNYFKSGGTFEVVVSPDGRIVGSVGLRLLGDRRAELCKLYLRPEVRGIGLGSFLLRRTIQRARELGCEEVRLLTHSVLRDAARLYQRQGFTAVQPEHPSTRCDRAYSLRLDARPISEEPDASALSSTGWTVYVTSPWRVGLPRGKEAGVPRQFGVGTALLMMTMFAILFAVLRSLNVPALAFAIIALFFLGVGAGQALLFHGRRPRRASIIMGIVMTFILSIFKAFFNGVPGPEILPSLALLFCAACFGGIIYGYVAGVLIGSVFLVSDKLRDAYRRRFPPKDEEP
jgi:putative acetyltransferase